MPMKIEILALHQDRPSHRCVCVERETSALSSFSQCDSSETALYHHLHTERGHERKYYTTLKENYINVLVI